MANLITCENGHLFSSRRYGTICPYCNVDTYSVEREDVSKRTNEDGTINSLEISEKVCGWLVCIEGICSGMSYPIKAGKNSIGSGDDMDIQILGDQDINVTSHAVIAYESATKKFTILPGTGKGIVYFEGKAVHKPADISSFEKLEMGNSTFLFMGFTGNRFSWEEGLIERKPKDSKEPKELKEPKSTKELQTLDLDGGGGTDASETGKPKHAEAAESHADNKD